MGRAVGAEYRFESISWGDAPGWDEVGALPLKSRALPGLGWGRGVAPEEYSAHRFIPVTRAIPLIMFTVSRANGASHPNLGHRPGNHP
jgi:hypothetical protein